MVHIVLAFDTATSIVVYSHAEGADDAPFPIAALLCSLSSYSLQSGWNLESMDLEDCQMQYHRGLTGLLWLMVSSNLLLQHEHIKNLLQVADAVVAMLLGQSICKSGHAAIKQHVKGAAACLDQLFQTANMQLPCPLATLLLPHQTILQPSAAAAGLPALLQAVTAAAGDGAAAALLLDGRYCSATPSWQSKGTLQLLALQLVAAAQSHQQAGHGQLLLHEAGGGSSEDGKDGTVQLLWCNLQHNLQLCLLTNSSYTLEQFMHGTQQLLISHKPGVAVEPLQLQAPVLAVAVADGASHWVTYNASEGVLDSRDGSCCWWWQAGMQLARQRQESVLLYHTGGRTVAAFSTGTSTTFLLAEGIISTNEVQHLLTGILPAVLLGA